MAWAVAARITSSSSPLMLRLQPDSLRVERQSIVIRDMIPSSGERCRTRIPHCRKATFLQPGCVNVALLQPAERRGDNTCPATHAVGHELWWSVGRAV
jgi:hypothetical protein